MGVEYIGAIVGFLTFLGGFIAWYRASVESNVSLKRDWGHLKKNQEQMIQNINFLSKEIDDRFDQTNNQLLELRGMFYASLSRRNEDKP